MEKWIEKIDVKNVSIHSKICDIHFDARCIRIDTDHKKKLLPGVIPLEFKVWWSIRDLFAAFCQTFGLFLAYLNLILISAWWFFIYQTFLRLC